MTTSHSELPHSLAPATLHNAHRLYYAGAGVLFRIHRWSEDEIVIGTPSGAIRCLPRDAVADQLVPVRCLGLAE
jgi:hypothetical protein